MSFHQITFFLHFTKMAFFFQFAYICNPGSASLTPNPLVFLLFVSPLTNYTDPLTCQLCFSEPCMVQLLTRNKKSLSGSSLHPTFKMKSYI